MRIRSVWNEVQLFHQRQPAIFEPTSTNKLCFVPIMVMFIMFVSLSVIVIVNNIFLLVVTNV